MPSSDLTQRIDAVRRFNRFYTRRVGALEDHYQESPFSLAEARVLYEVVHGNGVAASDIVRELGLDDGYLSRILRRFEKDKLIRREPSKKDGRQSLLSATARGREQFATLENATRKGIGEMLGALPPPTQDRVVAAMNAVASALSAQRDIRRYILRAPAAGDFGWIVESHGRLYGQEYGWTGKFEGLCAQIVADFINKNDPKRERCWIAEHNGKNAGSAMLVKDSETVARIRLLLVEPDARGLGIGEHLTAECIAFARACRYRKLTLWTHSILTGARRIYQRAGFKLVSSKPHKSWGKAVIGETWDLKL